MTNAEAVDEAAAHVHFAAACSNRAWTLIERTDRTPADDEQMIELNQASLWHWSQRADVGDRQRSIGYWQASRIRSLLGHAVEAVRYAKLCLDHSDGLSPFHRAYAHEAMARAASVFGDAAACKAHTMQARVWVQAIEKAEDRDLVVADLATLD